MGVEPLGLAYRVRTGARVTPAQLTAKAHALIAEGHSMLARAALEAAKAPVPTAAAAYTSASCGPFPPGKSRDWTRRNLKTIPGAYRVGQAWCISAADFLTWARARDLAAVKAEVAPAAPEAKAVAAAALAAMGYRKAG